MVPDGDNSIRCGAGRLDRPLGCDGCRHGGVDGGARFHRDGRGRVADRVPRPRGRTARTRSRLPGRHVHRLDGWVAGQSRRQLGAARSDRDEHECVVEGGVRHCSGPLGYPLGNAGGLDGGVRRHRGRQGSPVLCRRIRDGAGQRVRRLNRRVDLSRRCQSRGGILRIRHRQARRVIPCSAFAARC